MGALLRKRHAERSNLRRETWAYLDERLELCGQYVHARDAARKTQLPYLRGRARWKQYRHTQQLPFRRIQHSLSRWERAFSIVGD